MPTRYDSVIGIGGQSLVDGVWHLLGPAVAGLSNPLPVVLPGFSNAAMRITSIVPAVPGSPPAAGGLGVTLKVELSAEALLSVSVAADGVSISLGPQQLEVTKLTGTVGLPAVTGTLTNVTVGGNYPSPIGQVNLLQKGSGMIDLPASAAKLIDGSLSGTLSLPSGLKLPGVPFPAVVPVALDLTPTKPLAVDLDDVASLTNLRVQGSPGVNVAVNPTVQLLVSLMTTGFVLVGPAVGAVVWILVLAVCNVAASLLANSVRTILRAASLARSPAAVPPGVFEAFGRLVPMTLYMDDLTAYCVLQTPTSPWALMPRLGVEPSEITPPIG